MDDKLVSTLTDLVKELRKLNERENKRFILEQKSYLRNSKTINEEHTSK